MTTISKRYGMLGALILLTLVVGVIGRNLVKAHNENTEMLMTPEEIDQLLATYNDHLPARVDEFSILQRATFGPGNVLHYHYDVSDPHASSRKSVVLERIRIKHIEQYCTSSETKTFREKGLGIAQTYYMEGAPLGTVTARPEDCR